MDLLDYPIPRNKQEYLIALVRYSAHLNHAVAMAITNQTKLTPEILSMEGMSANGNRILLNALCSNVKAKYLEIGSWKGSTFVSALYKNANVEGTSIDHHQEFKGHMFESSSELLKANCEKYLTNGENYTLLTEDCFKTTFPTTQLYDIYLYDGWHSYEDQKKALSYYYDNLKPIFYYICDDYSIDRVEKGTQDAFKELDIQILSEHKLYGNQLVPFCAKTGFWNGYYVALCVKRKSFPAFFNSENPDKSTHCFDS